MDTTLDGTGDGAGPTTRRRAAFHPLTVRDVRRLTDAAIEVTFDVPDALQDEYDYVAGQYIALRTELDGQQVRRSYSICAEPRPGEIRIAIKRDLGGLFSNWANDELAPGHVIEVMNPQGAFVSKHRLTSLNSPGVLSEELVARGERHFVGVAAGSGITPVIAIARSVLANEDTTMDLVYANRAASDVMFLEDLADLKDRYPSRLALHHVLSREQRISPMHSGRVDAEKLGMLLEHVIRVGQVDEWFLCGPFELVQLVRDELAARDVDSDRVRFELFSTGQPGEGAQRSTGRPVVSDPEGDNVEIDFVLDGLSGQVTSPRSARETILNAALRVRPDVPFACAGGVCGTCRAKVTAGTVEMAENYALEADDVERGYVLTCQSRPTSDAVTVDFDV
ncbi:phenylacetate-CoA oxygenase/reductase subunit PaaK [Pseudoclavibacter chungangensis]|uniref:Phenylacetate-CoA oxygenase/reductase subunit PaaK n=1 Tax=Pseudoclavibacter chungangensis TaxID=587635 RepID=A0A7J5C013_9MICO|nr:phenylacetate-CoA oxygenase/reductase subunit PaaK [Pseudoclavibacter chungangensis]